MFDKAYLLRWGNTKIISLLESLDRAVIVE
jgi:hypothetical protein